MAKKRVTMAEIAAIAGVSKNTVSLALRGDSQVTDKTRMRIEAIARRKGYRRNPLMAHLMAILRQEQPVNYRCNLALINGHKDPHAFTRHHSIPAFVEGCNRRAQVHGYRFDNFWLHDPELTAQRLDRIMRTRGIKGMIIHGLFQAHVLPERFDGLWDRFPAVVTGVRTTNPPLPFCCVDHHEAVLDSMENIRRLGYRRTGLMLSTRVDTLVDFRFSSAFMIAQEGMRPENRVPIYTDVDADLPQLNTLNDWMNRYKPDSILTIHTNTREWLEAIGYHAPDDIGLIHLERNRLSLDWAGIDQHNEAAGEAAVDLVSMLLQTGEFGSTVAPRATLIGGTWVNGSTVRSRD